MDKHTPTSHLAADSALVRNLPLDMRSAAQDMNNITEAQTITAQDWASDCLSMDSDQRASAERSIRYVERNYPGGWDAFVAECRPEAKPAEQVLTAVPYPRTDGMSWGVTCPVHFGYTPTDRERYRAEAFAEALACSSSH